MKEGETYVEVRYLIIAGIIVLIASFMFIVMNKCLEISWFKSLLVSSIFAETQGFHYKRKWVFKSINTKRIKLQFFLYFLHAIIYFFINRALMHQFVDVYKFEAVSVQLLIVVTFIFPNFEINNAIFHRTKNPVP